MTEKDNNNSQNNNTQQPPKCPNCGKDLGILMTGTDFGCANCNKYYENKNGSVGKEIPNPYADPKADY